MARLNLTIPDELNNSLAHSQQKKLRQIKRVYST